ncbi:MAG: tyrosine-type recombinase/integrase [Gemmataceae bacterium]
MNDERIIVWLLNPNDRPFYKLEWREPGTNKRKSKSTKTGDKTTAERMRHDLESDLNNGRFQEKSKLLWSTFRTRYEQEKLVNVRENSRKKAAAVFDSFERLVAPGKLSRLDESTFSAYTAKLRALKRRPATIHGHLSYLSAAMHWAVKMGLIAKMPYIELPRLPEPEEIRTIILEEYERLIMSAPTEWWRVFIATAWFTGMRRNEILALSWDKRDEPYLDLDAKQINIPGDKQKNGKTSWLPLHPDLEEMFVNVRNKLLAKGVKTTGPIFPFANLPSQCSNLFKGIAAKAGLDIGLHDLRRSFASRYASQVPAPVLQRLMRHANITTTMKFYTKIDNVLRESILKA